MTFKRYDGFVGSAPQSMIDNGLPICPFCGESPHWLLELESGMVSAMTCMCEKCGAKLYTENHGFQFDNNLRIVDVGRKNLEDLKLNSVYHIKSLKSISDDIVINKKKNDKNHIFEGYDEDDQIENDESPNINDEEKAPSSKRNYKPWLALIVGVIIFIVSLCIFLGPSCESKEVEVVLNQSMSVDEFYGTYTATVTGTVKNNKSYTLDYVAVTISLYDSVGNVVGTAIDNQLNLQSGETWRFSALGMSSTTRPVSCKVTDVTYY